MPSSSGRESWVKRGTSSIGVFKEDAALRVVVWIDRECAMTMLRSPEDLDAFPAWLGPRLERQRVALDAAEAEARRRAALPLPEVDAVIELLKSGARVVTSGARYHETFFWDGGLRVEIFDEGDVDIREATKARLREAIGYYPDAFREALGQLG